MSGRGKVWEDRINAVKNTACTREGGGERGRERETVIYANGKKKAQFVAWSFFYIWSGETEGEYVRHWGTQSGLDYCRRGLL